MENMTTLVMVFGTLTVSLLVSFCIAGLAVYGARNRSAIS